MSQYEMTRARKYISIENLFCEHVRMNIRNRVSDTFTPFIPREKPTLNKNVNPRKLTYNSSFPAFSQFFQISGLKISAIFTIYNGGNSIQTLVLVTKLLLRLHAVDKKVTCQAKRRLDNTQFTSNKSNHNIIHSLSDSCA